MKKILLLTLTIISLRGISSNFNGYWIGKFEWNGSAWNLRLHIEQSKDTVSAYLDIPSLVFANEPIEVAIINDTLSLTLPFGINKVSFTRNKERLEPLNKLKTPFFIKTEAPPYEIKTLNWRSGSETLEGSIYMPKTVTKPPLLIRVHGSNIGNRENWEYRSWGDYFARKGIATVVFDRRGEGASTNYTNDQSFDSLANDVVRLILYLKKRDIIDTNKIILSGGSQGAYISFLAYTATDEIDFMLLSGAPSVSVVEQERQSLIFRMRANGESNQSIEEALSYQNLYFHYVMSGNNWKALKKEAIRTQAKSWAKYTDQPRNEVDLKWWRENYNAYQPELLIPKIKIPTLILFGENDLVTPPSVMIPQFRRLIAKSNNDSFKIVVCASVGHSLELEFAKDRWGNTVFPQRSPIMFDAIESWLDKFELIHY